jgi:hypothetical protein
LDATIKSVVGFRAALKLLHKDIELGDLTFKEWPIARAKYQKQFNTGQGSAFSADPGDFMWA